MMDCGNIANGSFSSSSFGSVLVIECRLQKWLASKASSSPQSQQPPWPGGRSRGIKLKKTS